MDRHANDTPNNLRSTSEQFSANGPSTHLKTALLVAGILLVGAVVGHAVLSNEDASGTRLLCSEGPVKTICSSSETCSLDQCEPAGKQGGCAKACNADISEKQAACPLRATTCSVEQSGCAKTRCPLKQPDQSQSCCPTSAQE